MPVRRVSARDVWAAQAEGAGVGVRELPAAVAIVLAKLPDQQRQAVALHHVFGLSQAAAAEAMGVSQPSISRLLKRAARRAPGIMRELQTVLLSVSS